MKSLELENTMESFRQIEYYVEHNTKIHLLFFLYIFESSEHK